MEQTDYQQKFEELFCTNIKREGAQQLLDWLKRTDFLRRRPAQSITAPVKRVW